MLVRIVTVNGDLVVGKIYYLPTEYRTHMRSPTRLDARGRLTIRREYRAILRDRVVQILTPHGVLLRPVPDRLKDRGRLPPALTASGEGEADREAGE